jgi:hypothetical protein
MTYKLFIDDERFPPESWVGTGPYRIARTSSEAQFYVDTFGMPNFISFDHDLGIYNDGVEDTSINFINWLVEAVLDNRVQIPDNFDFYVHSQNPVGKENIESKMTALLHHVRNF